MSKGFVGRVAAISTDIELLDQKIQRQEEEVRQLKTQRNTLALISMLPPEILSQAFLYCITFDDKRYCGAYRWPWIQISHVCSHWRNVALGCPALWSCLEFSCPAWVPEMLQRSKMAPLSVKVTAEDFFNTKVKDAIETTLQQVSRVSDLMLCMPGGEKSMAELLVTGMRQAAPLLRSLSLSTSISAWTRGPVTLPLEFVDGDAPRLKHLELRNFHLPWDSALLKNLTSLKIFHTSTGSAPSLQQLTDVLARMPGLEILELKDVLPICKSTTPVDTVPLPHLHRIKLDGDTVSVALLLDHISFPSTTQMHFVCVVGNIDSNALIDKASALLSPLSKIRSRLSEPSSSHSQHKPSTLNITSTYAELHIVAGRCCDGSSAPNSAPPWLDLTMKGTIAVSTKKGELAAKILEALSPLTSIRHLTLNAPHNFFAVKTFAKVISSLNQVHVFHAEGPCVSDVFKGLQLLRKGMDRVLIFPSLKVLTLTSVDFDPNREEEYEVVDQLQTVLMSRYEAKAEIRSLTLKTCSRLSSHDVQQLRDICVSVRWDGIEDFEDEDEDEEDMFDYDDMMDDSDDDDLMYFGGPVSFPAQWWYPGL
ncbi:hypothetical protein D9758_007485 [Tetrapyrgos nigripes]|uniref:F-box domain-containing protein n=1 Tax=Tetrapyrgos nigripes TaxID=182062 RepID=A0A8H5G3L1_9AGAR|nr:hypothetical protein D9758_007485 [Tetrapyrgos nigripes]